MKGAQTYAIAAVIVVIIVAVVVLTMSPISGIPTGLSIQPAAQTVQAGSVFSVNVNTKDIDDIRGFQFDLSYDTAILEVVSVSEGGFLKSDGRQSFWVAPDLSEAGMIKHPAAVVIGPGPGVNGDGVLATIQFRAKSAGSSQLGLSGVKMVNSQAAPNNLISNVILTGAVVQVV